MKKPDEFKYAVNSFVKDVGEESYDIEQQGRTTRFTITVPGKTPVEDLPKIKHFHKDKTLMAIFIPVGSVVVASPVILWFVFVASMMMSAQESMKSTD